MDNHLINLITNLRNAINIKAKYAYTHDTRLNREVLKVLQKFNFIDDWMTVSSHTEYKPHKYRLAIIPSYNLEGFSSINKIKAVSTPGHRIFAKIKQIQNFNVGEVFTDRVFILSTNKGLLTNIEATLFHIGGEVLFYIN
jgi:ribosomal protein S8